MTHSFHTRRSVAFLDQWNEYARQTQAAPVNYTVFWRMFHLVNQPDLPISLLLADDSAVWRIVRTQLAGIGAMKSKLCVVFTMATALSLAACDGKPENSVPVGQVIASVRKSTRLNTRQ